MRFTSDRQRRAMFAKMNRAGVSLSPVEIEFKSGKYSDILVSDFKEPSSATTSDDVPDWVSNAPKPVVEQSTSQVSDKDYLLQYADTIKPAYDTSIKVVGDKSDIIKEADDMLLQYAAVKRPEKKIVGATKILDDEYEITGPTRLQIRGKPKKELDELLL